MGMKLFSVYSVLLLMVHSVYATIVIDHDAEIFNLGDQIEAGVVAVHSNDIHGFLQMNVQCEDRDLNYFVTPVEIKREVPFEVEITSLTALPSMRGTCTLVAQLRDDTGVVRDSEETENFTVSDTLEVDLTTIEGTVDPGDYILLNGTVRKQSSALIDEGVVEYTVDETTHPSPFEDGTFAITLTVGKNMKAGKQRAVLAVNDEFGNTREVEVHFVVTQLPTTLVAILNARSFKTSDVLIIDPEVLDQAGDPMDVTATVSLLNPAGKVVTSTSAPLLEYTLTSFEAPGDYIITVAAEGLISEEMIEVLPTRSVDVTLIGDVAQVSNTGNTDYAEEVTFLLENEGKKYVVNKKVKLKPDKTLDINLAKEVPDGLYTVTLPTSERIENVDVAQESGWVRIAGNAVGTPFEGKEDIALLSVLGIVLIVSALFVFKRLNKQKTEEL